MKGFRTVPWAPSLDGQQLTRSGLVHLRSTAVIWQMGIRKGFNRESVIAHLRGVAALDATPRQDRNRLALVLELGMLEEQCDCLADEFSVKVTR